MAAAAEPERAEACGSAREGASASKRLRQSSNADIPQTKMAMGRTVAGCGNPPVNGHLRLRGKTQNAHMTPRLTRRRQPEHSPRGDRSRKKAGERRQAHGRTSEPRRQAERAAPSARRRHHAMESGEKTSRFLRESAALHGRSRPARPQGASLNRIIPGRHRLRQRSRREIAAPAISPHADPHFFAGSDAEKRQPHLPFVFIQIA